MAFENFQLPASLNMRPPTNLGGFIPMRQPSTVIPPNFNVPQAPAAPNPALERYRAAIMAGAQTPAYEPPPPVMLPRLPAWALLAAGLIGANDPTQTVVPSFAQGLSQGGQAASQNEAIRRQAAIESARARTAAETGVAQLDYNSAMAEAERTAEMDKVRLQGRNALDLEAARGGNRVNVEQAKAILRVVVKNPEARGAFASSGYDFNAPEFRTALAELTTEEEFERSRTALNNFNIDKGRFMLPIEGRYMEAGIEGRQAGAADTRSRTTERNTMLPIKKDQGLANVAGTKARTEGQGIKNRLDLKFGGKERAVKIREIEQRIRTSAANATRALASAKKLNDTTGGVMSFSQERLFTNNLITAANSLSDLKASMDYMESMKSVWEEDATSGDAAVAAAAQVQLDSFDARMEFVASQYDQALRNYTMLSSLPRQMKPGMAAPGAMPGALPPPGPYDPSGLLPPNMSLQPESGPPPTGVGWMQKALTRAGAATKGKPAPSTATPKTTTSKPARNPGEKRIHNGYEYTRQSDGKWKRGKKVK